jgi:hypothetical protein
MRPRLTTKLLRGLHGGECAVQRRQIGELHVSGLDMLRGELKIPGGTSIASEKALKPKVRGGADRRVHAHVGHHAGKNQRGCVDGTQQVVEGRFAEAVRKVLYDQRFAFGRTDRAMNLGAGGAWKEEGGSSSLGNVLDVNDRKSLLPKGLHELGRLGHSGLRTNQFHRSAREVVILQIDENKGCSHDEWSCVRYLSRLPRVLAASVLARRRTLQSVGQAQPSLFRMQSTAARRRRQCGDHAAATAIARPAPPLRTPWPPLRPLR